MTKQQTPRPLSTAAAFSFRRSAATFISLDDAMRAVGDITQAGTDDLAAMTAEAKRLRDTTSFPASEVVRFMTELALAGLNPTEIIDEIRGPFSKGMNSDYVLLIRTKIGHHQKAKS